MLQTEALRKEVEAAQLQECTFQPRLQPRPRPKAGDGHAARPGGAASAEAATGPAAKAEPRAPLRERLAELQKERRCA